MQMVLLILAEMPNLADAEKTKWLEVQGYTVLRFWDDEVMKNIEGVREKIICWIKENHNDKLPENLLKL